MAAKTAATVTEIEQGRRKNRATGDWIDERRFRVEGVTRGAHIVSVRPAFDLVPQREHCDCSRYKSRGACAHITAVDRVPRALMDKWCGTVHCGDCVGLMNKLPAGSLDLIVTSPPYNIRNSTGNGMKDGRGGKWKNAALIRGYIEHDDAMPHEEYVAWQRECLTAMMRVLRQDGAIFYNHKWRVQGGLLQDRSDIVAGFPVRQIIIWQREGGFNFNPGYFLPTYEVIYLICKPDFKLARKGNAIGDVWRIPQESNNPHPAPFPVELAQRCINATTAQMVLDPFMGSGTTAIAAEFCGLQWIGIEKSKEYCKLAKERILAARGLSRK